MENSSEEKNLTFSGFVFDCGGVRYHFVVPLLPKEVAEIIVKFHGAPGGRDENEGPWPMVNSRGGVTFVYHAHLAFGCKCKAGARRTQKSQLKE